MPGLDISPPAWLVRVIQPRPARFPWAEMARVLVAIAAPLGVGELTGQLSLSSIVAMGALAAALTDNGGPLEHRLRRTATAVVFGAIGMLAGRLLGGQAWLAVGAVAVLSLASAMMSVVGAIGSVAGLQLLVYFAIGGGSLVVVPPPTLLTGYLIGAVWGILCTVVRSLLEGRRRPEREAVAGVYQKIAELLAATGTPWMQQARRALTDAMNQAFDLLLDYRARSAGRDWAALRLATLLNAGTPLVEATVAIAYDGNRPPPNLHGAAVAVAGAIRANGPAPEIELGPAPSNPLFAAWRRAGENVLASWDRYATPSAPPPFGGRLRSALDQVVTGRATWLYALRLVLCMSLAETLHSVVPLARSYWVLLTVAIVLKPDFGSVFVRGLQRALGTVIGVVIGFGMLLLLPDKLLIVLGIAVIAALLPYAILRNYGMFSTFLTPLVVLLIDLTSPSGQPSGVAAGEARLVDTLAGCAIVLVFGFLLWPETWRPRLGPRIADAAASVGDYLEAALLDPGRGRQLRRRTYRRLSDLRTAFQQTLAEPPPMSTRAAAWWPLIVQLESATDAITEAAIRARAGAPAPAPG
ncbi:MAG: FUSC family protein, partial [Candidatus Dormiibacterota bacterium]